MDALAERAAHAPVCCAMQGGCAVPLRHTCHALVQAQLDSVHWHPLALHLHGILRGWLWAAWAGGGGVGMQLRA